MHCGVNVSELYGVFVLHRQLNILFLPMQSALIVDVYTGNEIII